MFSIDFFCEYCHTIILIFPYSIFTLKFYLKNPAATRGVSPSIYCIRHQCIQMNRRAATVVSLLSSTNLIPLLTIKTAKYIEWRTLPESKNHTTIRFWKEKKRKCTTRWSLSIYGCDKNLSMHMDKLSSQQVLIRCSDSAHVWILGLNFIRWSK